MREAAGVKMQSRRQFHDKSGYLLYFEGGNPFPAHIVVVIYEGSVVAQW